MRRIFHGSKQNTATASAVEKDLKGAVFNVSGLHVAIENKIAEGGFSFVYVVRCNKTNRVYALKRQFVNELRLLEACKREIEITRTLGAHPNIVSYVSSSLKAGPDGVYEYLLVTNYYKDSVLQMMNDRLAAGKYLTIKEILKIFSDVCCAVARLHHCQTPVIHRDLKVENLLLEPTTSTKSGSSSDRSSTHPHHHNHQASTFPFNCVLCDFGSCTTRHVTPGDKASSISTSSTMLALQDEIARFTTLSYRAPELVDLYSGFPITTKVDIWALGVMLFKLCFFTLPFGESTLAIQSATFSFPSEPSYPAELLGLIIYLLNPDPHKRPDIFQLASVVFCLLGQECPVKNLNNTEAVSMQYVVQLYANFQNKNRCISTTIADSIDSPNNRTAVTPSKLSSSSSQNCDMNAIIGTTKPTTQMVPEIVNPTTNSTSVVPRQRPRVQQTAISPATAFTLINNRAENAVGPWKPKVIFICAYLNISIVQTLRQKFSRTFKFLIFLKTDFFRNFKMMDLRERSFYPMKNNLINPEKISRCFVRFSIGKTCQKQKTSISREQQLGKNYEKNLTSKKQ
uniref:non-specific serine/threonine protein kinase n=1 Tax=Romanomermis culicivorax TaxID=13658 RepID=A0A915HKF9_ROMCU